jgi:TfoX/Sxy family transcriptional regulator of competence genes
MEIPKPSDADKQHFRELAPDAPAVEVKPMFGNLGAFVNGNMFMGLFGSDIGVKLPDDQLDELLAQPGSGPFGPAERPMGGYATLPSDWSKRKVTPWIDKALAHVAALPPKVPRKRAAKDAATKGAAKKRA